MSTIRQARFFVAVIVGVLATAPWRPAASQGLVYGWGFNAGGGYGDCVVNGFPNTLCGQTGVPNATVVATPAALAAVSDAIAIGAGMFHSLAVRRDGTVWAWGMNSGGQLGSGGSWGTYSVVPIQVPQINDAIAVAGGWHQSHAIRSDGSLWSWGSAWTGLGTYSSIAPPTRVPGLSGVVAVAAGEITSHAVLADGTLWSWGFDANGSLGTGSFSGVEYSPVQVTALQDVAAVSTHFAHVLALKRDGTVWAWGDNSQGQVGDGTFVNRRTPVAVSGLAHIVQIAAGSFNSYALRDDGTVWTWGSHSGFYYPTPVPIGGFTNIQAIAAGGWHLLARTADGTVLGWGANEWGQLGLSTVTAFEWVPTEIVGIPTIGLLTAGRAHSLAATADLTPPSLTLPGDVYVDGTSPDGEFVDYAVSAVDDMDPNPTIVCVPPSGGLFPLLLTTVTCTATDASGNSATGQFNVIVKDAYWQLQDLTGLLASWNLGKLGSSLLDKLETVRRFIVAGKTGQVCSALTNFLSQVGAQVGKGLTLEQADELMIRAKRIQNVCGC